MLYHRIRHLIWLEKDTKEAFLRCTKWQLEETLNPFDCPYHYYCCSTYPGDYPNYVDALVLSFIVASFLSTMVLSLIDISSRRMQTRLKRMRRYFLPSGPVSLPIMLLTLAKGHRINTLFPIACTGPAILQLIRVSALAFESETGSAIRYLLLEVYTLSGVVHAALYLDSIILPYYTGLDALVNSTFPGECIYCICRQKALVPGGELISYRAWSVTTALVVGTLCLRISCRLAPEYRDKSLIVKSMLESLSWILMTAECVYLMTIFPSANTWQQIGSSCGIFVLLCLHILRRILPWLAALLSDNQVGKVQL